MGFVHLCGHSTFSMLESIGSLGLLLTRAKEMGMGHLGIMDYNGLYGAVSFYKKAKDYDINPIVGVELTFVLQGGRQVISGLGHTLGFLAKNYDGYQALMRLVTRAYEHNADTPWIELSDLSLIAHDVYVIVGGSGSWLAHSLGRGISPDKIEDGLTLLLDAVGKENVLCGIAVRDYSLDSSIRDLNDFLFAYAAKSDLICFASCFFHYPSAKYKYPAEVALAIKDGKKMYEPNRRKITDALHMMSEDEVRSVLEVNGLDVDLVDEIMMITEDIASGVSLSIPLWQSLFPHHQTPDYITDLYKRHGDALVED